MAALFRLYLDICLLRRGPQDVPAAPVLLWLTAVAYFMVGVMVSRALYDVRTAVFLSALDMALSAGLLATILWSRGVFARWPQTFTALCGSQMLLNLGLWPVFMWYVRVQSTPDALLPSLLSLAVWIWSVVVIGHVLRHALNMPLWLGNAIAFGFQWSVTILVQGILRT